MNKPVGSVRIRRQRDPLGALSSTVAAVMAQKGASWLPAVPVQLSNTARDVVRTVCASLRIQIYRRLLHSQDLPSNSRLGRLFGRLVTLELPGYPISNAEVRLPIPKVLFGLDYGDLRLSRDNCDLFVLQ